MNSCRTFDDYRPAVHDSDGLMMLTGAGEWICGGRSPIPKTLQVSAFVDNNPGGFGLMQRKRRYGDFLDLEAKYEKPAEPVGRADRRLGPGLRRTLRDPLAAGDQRQYRRLLAAASRSWRKDSSASFVYRLYWCDEWPARAQGLQGDGEIFRRRPQFRPEQAPLCHRLRGRRPDRRCRRRCYGSPRDDFAMSSLSPIRKAAACDCPSNSISDGAGTVSNSGPFSSAARSR